MKQVLLNLILNSIHAMPNGGTLTLSARLTADTNSGGSGVCLSVSDTGVGIPAAQRSRIFDPFFTTRDEGTGLGLAIVHAIVEGHRGRIDVESEEGRGTTFALTLPNHHAPSPASIHESTVMSSSDGYRATEMMDERLLVGEETSA
jgi:signal transduction histidine kinase